ncbi:Low-density lipoprotein receptor domain class A [Cooperia oncophora]
MMDRPVAGRLPGRCLPGDFDCGFGRCVPVTSFHDGKPDCYDGSDEWCFFGQVKCGAYCVDVSQAFSCLFSSRCDDSSRQPPWCSVSKEKLCGEPSAFPCRGYGECVLWPWLLDGEKHCIDGSDEDQLYVRALEFSFRCYYNRTRQVAMPPPLNYTDTFLKLTNPNQLPDIRPPQFPTLFPPLSTLPSPDLYLTSPSSFTQPPPVQLSKITGLPPLPPPFPTLLPPTPPSNPSVIQLGPNPIVPTEQTVLVPDSISSPDDPFVKLSRPLSTSTQAPSSPKSTYSPNYNSNEQESQSPLLSTTSSTTPSTAQPPSVKTVVIVPTKPHVRGRLTTTRPWSVQSTTSGRLTHIQVVTELITSGDGDLIASSSGQGTTEREREKQGMSSSGSKPDRLNTLDPAVSGQATATPPKTSAPGGYAGVLIPLPDESAVNPKFRTTIRPQTSQIDNDHSDQSLISSSSSEMNSVRMTDSNTATSPAPSLPNPAISGSVESGSNSYSTTITPTTITTTTTTVIPTTARNLCLTDLITTSQNRYSSRECQCPTGEMLLNEHCEVIPNISLHIVASEGNLAFYKLNIQSACGEETLTPDQKKWIAIGKVCELVGLRTQTLIHLIEEFCKERNLFF